MASDFVGTERIAQPREPAGFERNHVEPARGLIPQVRDTGHQKMLRGAYDALLLLPPDTRRSATISALRTRADFDEHERAVTLAHHQIDLAAAARHIARDEPQTLALQKFLRTRLESRTDEFGPGASRKVVRRGEGTDRRRRAHGRSAARASQAA